jgi:hypothetical protein
MFSLCFPTLKEVRVWASSSRFSVRLLAVQYTRTHYTFLANNYKWKYNVRVLCSCVLDWQRVYVFVPTIYLPYNLFSFLAVICNLYTISCSVSIIIEPFLSNILTFHDPINVSTLSNPSFFGLIRGYSSILSITPLHGVGFFPQI